MNYSALVLHENSSLCAARPCSSLNAILRNLCQVNQVQAQHLEANGAAISFVPDVVVLRLQSQKNLAERIEHWRKRWPKACWLAIFCPPGEPDPELLDGLDDFLCCPYGEQELACRIQRLLSHGRRVAGAPLGVPHRLSEQFPLVGESALFRRVIDKLPLVANSQQTVLISGETGSGKEVVARAIHYQGQRRGKPFVAVNCGALPDHLFENELFGHIKGAFTDASSTEKGLIAEAEGGTLFLDEVDALTVAGQIKLLRFLQDGEFRPVGASRARLGDVRVIAATNADLASRVETGVFRQDLYYRLNALALAIPPLRQRLDDLKPLSDFFLARFAQQQGEPMRRLSDEAMAKLTAFSWPGNVRELESVITRALTFTQSPTVRADDIELPATHNDAKAAVSSLRAAKLSTVQAFERDFLVNLLAKHRGNVSHAAKAAGKERRTFQRLLRKHNLHRDAF